MRPGLDPEVELGVVADVVAVDLHREAADVPVSVRETDSMRASVRPVELVDLAVVGERAGRSASTRVAIVGMSRWVARRSTASASVPLSSAASSQTRTGSLPK